MPLFKGVRHTINFHVTLGSFWEFGLEAIKCHSSYSAAMGTGGIDSLISQQYFYRVNKGNYSKIGHSCFTDDDLFVVKDFVGVISAWIIRPTHRHAMKNVEEHIHQDEGPKNSAKNVTTAASTENVIPVNVL